MGYRDSDDSGFSRHGMNRDNDHPELHQQQPLQRSHRAGYDHPDLDRDEDLRTSRMLPADQRTSRHAPYGAPRRDSQGWQGPEGRDANRDFGRNGYQGPGGWRNSDDTGYGYGSRSPDIGGYGAYEAEQRWRRQQPGQYGGGSDHGPDDRLRLTRPGTWANEGYGRYGDGSGGAYSDRDHDGHYRNHQGRSYGHGFDGRPDAGYGNPLDADDGYASSRQALGNHGYRNSDQGQGGARQGPYAQQPYRGSQRERHDPDYSAWRQEQLRLLDEDYDSWRNERYQKFSEEFNTWRSARNRNEGLRGSSQSDPVASASGGGKNQQQQQGSSGTTGGITGTGSPAATTAATSGGNKPPKDTAG